VGSLTLAGVVDSLVSGLLGQLQQVGATVGSLTGGVAGVAMPAQASGALSTVSTQLATLTTQLQALPTGAALGGLKTIGLDASLGGAGAQASFLPSPPSPAAPSAPTAAPDPRPGVEIPRSLPRTGGTRTLELVALGLLLLVGGWQLLEMAATAAGRRPGTGGSVSSG
jgi:LPXTG-motif cell wall-anchored protein